MFKIHYSNGNISNPFATVEQATNWAVMTSTAFDVVDMDGLVVYRHEEADTSDHDFICIDIMGYTRVRRMNRE